VGVVTAVGPEVDNFKVGDLAGVGCMVDSCRKCVVSATESCSISRVLCGACAALPAARWLTRFAPSSPPFKILHVGVQPACRLSAHGAGTVVTEAHVLVAVHRCEQCKEGDEQYCSSGATMTYSGAEPGTKDVLTRGGYSDHVIVDKECVCLPSCRCCKHPSTQVCAFRPAVRCSRWRHDCYCDEGCTLAVFAAQFRLSTPSSYAAMGGVVALLKLPCSVSALVC